MVHGHDPEAATAVAQGLLLALLFRDMGQVGAK